MIKMKGEMYWTDSMCTVLKLHSRSGMIEFDLIGPWSLSSGLMILLLLAGWLVRLKGPNRSWSQNFDYTAIFRSAKIIKMYRSLNSWADIHAIWHSEWGQKEGPISSRNSENSPKMAVILKVFNLYLLLLDAWIDNLCSIIRRSIANISGNFDTASWLSCCHAVQPNAIILISAKLGQPVWKSPEMMTMMCWSA